MATIIKTNGEVLPYKGKFDLKSLQKIVGGFIELVYLKDDKVLVINEEGKLMDLDANPKATKLFIETWAGRDNDLIVGDVLYADKKEID